MTTTLHCLMSHFCSKIFRDSPLHMKCSTNCFKGPYELVSIYQSNISSFYHSFCFQCFNQNALLSAHHIPSLRVSCFWFWLTSILCQRCPSSIAIAKPCSPFEACLKCHCLHEDLPHFPPMQAGATFPSEMVTSLFLPLPHGARHFLLHITVAYFPA